MEIRNFFIGNKPKSEITCYGVIIKKKITLWHELSYNLNMKYLKISLLLITATAIFFSACKDEPIEPQDKEIPVITKIYPSFTHQSYDFGDTAFFKIKFKDNQQLANVSLRLYLETGEEILLISKSPAADSASIDTFVIMNDLRFSDLDFTIKAVDVAGNVALQSSHIHLR